MTKEKTFGVKLKGLRKKKELTLRKLANGLHITHAYLYQIEKGIVIPSEELAKRVARFFEEDEEEIVFLARDVAREIKRIAKKYPMISPAYFKEVIKKGEK